MITKLLNEINEEIEKLNHLLEDKQYLRDLEKRIEDINNRTDRTNRENERLHSIIKKVRKYLGSNEWGIDYEHSNCRTHLLEILDKVDKKK